MKYAESLNNIRKIAQDLFAIIGVVAAISFWSFFTLEAQIACETRYLNIKYNRGRICQKLKEFNLEIPLHMIITHKNWYYKVVEQKFYTKNNIIFGSDTLKDREAGFEDNYSDLKKSIVYKEQAKSADFIKLPEAQVNNRSFWETILPQLLEDKCDSVTVYKSLKIVLSEREIISTIHVVNSGKLTATDIKIYLDRPRLLMPRLFSHNTVVDFIDVDFNYYNASFERTPSGITINIPILRPNESQMYTITTSFTNISDGNIKYSYKSLRDINIDRILYTFIIVIFIYYALPFLAYIYRIKKIINKLKK